MQWLVHVNEDRYPIADGHQQDRGERGKGLPDKRKDEHRGDDAECVVGVGYWGRK